MFQVLISQEEYSAQVILAELENVVEAVQLALAVHQSSNKPHFVRVFDPGAEDHTILRLPVSEVSNG